MKTIPHVSTPALAEAVEATPSAKPLVDNPLVDSRPLDAWVQQIMVNMRRMASDEEYRKRIASQLS